MKCDLDSKITLQLGANRAETLVAAFRRQLHQSHACSRLSLAFEAPQLRLEEGQAVRRLFGSV